MKFNLNDHVRVKLTDYGRTIHRADHEEFWANALRSNPNINYAPSYRSPTEDADGWSEWQLWQLMQIFGPFMVMGWNRLPFETTIELLVLDAPGGPPPIVPR